MSSEPLFSEFPPVSTEQWEEHIRRDLQGADYEETLLWHMPDGITARPYYRAGDIEHLAHVATDAAPLVAMPRSSLIRQDIATPDMQAAREHARAALAGGVDVLGISLRVSDNAYTGVPLMTRTAFEAFAEALPIDRVSLHLDAGSYSPALFALLLGHLEQRSLSNDAELTVAFDPIGEISRSGRHFDAGFDMAADMVAVASAAIPRGRVLQVGAGTFHNAGATPVQETALLLASTVELVHQLTQRGLTAKEIIRHIHIAVPVASSYLVEIAKLRALRSAMSQVLSVLLSDESPDDLSDEEFSIPPIHGESSDRNLTLYDPHTNLLRATTEAAAAQAGGCDVVSVHLFDELAGRFDEFSYRMARNIQHIVRQEAGFSRVADPAAGSYYVEVLTDAIARRAWRRFQEIEECGGLLEALRSGMVQEQLTRAQAFRQTAVSSRRRILVGTTHYPDADERRDADLRAAPDPQDLPPAPTTTLYGGFQELADRLANDEPISVMRSVHKGPRLGAPLRSKRDAVAMERIRLRTERGAHNPTVLLVPLGDTVIRSARANFARNFLGCAGFLVLAPTGFDALQDAIVAIREAEPDAVVFCAPDTEYAHILSDVSPHLLPLTPLPIKVIVASPDVTHDLIAGVYDFAIHRNSDLFGTLKDLQERLRDFPNLSEEEQ